MVFKDAGTVRVGAFGSGDAPANYNFGLRAKPGVITWWGGAPVGHTKAPCTGVGGQQRRAVVPNEHSKETLQALILGVTKNIKILANVLGSHTQADRAPC